MIPNAAKTAQPPTTPATIEMVFGFELASGLAVSVAEESGDEVVAAPVVTGAMTIEVAGGDVADAGSVE